MLDLHLLCTRVPRSGGDADLVFAPPVQGHDHEGQGPRYVTVVEVLLDEMGVWEGRGGKTGVRRNREQRWAAVEVRKGKVVNAFASGAT
jgi:hypothetical protein